MKELEGYLEFLMNERNIRWIDKGIEFVFEVELDMYLSKNEIWRSKEEEEEEILNNITNNMIWYQIDN